MPSTIPYDPSLVLASIVHKEVSDNIVKLAQTAAPADAAQDHLNSLISLRRSLDMTRMELKNLGIIVADFDKEITNVSSQIQSAGIDYAQKRITSERLKQQIKSSIPSVHVDYESPVDFMRTGTKPFPFAADSLNMDVQYFSFDENSQDSQSFASDVSSYVGSSVSSLGDKASSQMTAAVNGQINKQAQAHSLAGTLVIAVTCTHKNTLMLAPFALNVDKGIRVWNKMFPDDLINMNDPKSVAQIAAQDETQAEKHTLDIISGVSYGSSFVGMVHVLNTTETKSSQKMQDVASTLQAQMSVGSWFENAKGGFGVNDDIANSVKNLLSSQSINSHVSVISMGLIPSIVANNVALAVAQFSDFDPAKEMDQIAKLSASTESEQNSVADSAAAARTGGQVVAMRGATIQNVLSGVGLIDDKANAMIDVNSMMGALQDYIKRVPEQASGVPINYYIKSISKAQLAQMWVAKYMPEQYLAISNDDLPPTQAGQAGSAPAEQSAQPASSTTDAAPPPADASTSDASASTPDNSAAPANAAE